MNKTFLLKNFRAWGELPKGDYDRTYYENKQLVVISKDATANGLAKVLNNKDELNILINFIRLDNFEEIMEWVGHNSLSIPQMLTILRMDNVEQADVEELIFINDFPEYAAAKYISSKKIWRDSFEAAIQEMLDKEGYSESLISYLSEGKYTSETEGFSDEVLKFAEIDRKDFNRYYRNSEEVLFYGTVRFADEYMSRETKRELVGDKFDNFIMWATAAATNEVKDKFIYKNKGKYNEKRHYEEVTLKEMVLNLDNMFVL